MDGGGSFFLLSPPITDDDFPDLAQAGVFELANPDDEVVAVDDEVQSLAPFLAGVCDTCGMHVKKGHELAMTIPSPNTLS
mmetsp:Transcript_24447/g.27966  ORF Transcript_24447/g.27966 Transcript_24447/m.27966 type:complete len:80 (-) Transcript_24447:466-705(-)